MTRAALYLAALIATAAAQAAEPVRIGITTSTMSGAAMFTPMQDLPGINVAIE